jgi:hypothetical protein
MSCEILQEVHSVRMIVGASLRARQHFAVTAVFHFALRTSRRSVPNVCLTSAHAQSNAARPGDNRDADEFSMSCHIVSDI